MISYIGTGTTRHIAVSRETSGELRDDRSIYPLLLLPGFAGTWVSSHPAAKGFSGPFLDGFAGDFRDAGGQ